MEMISQKTIFELYLVATQARFVRPIFAQWVDYRIRSRLPVAEVHSNALLLSRSENQSESQIMNP